MPKVDVRKNEPTIPGLGAEKFEYTVSIIAGDKSTDVEIKNEDDLVIGRGFSKRRKGDRRSDTLGVALALARAFEDASNGYAGIAEDILEGRQPK